MSATERRVLLYADYTGPGPLKYNRRTTVGTREHCLTKRRAPAFSVGIRLAAKQNEFPGPTYMLDPCLTNKGRQVPPAFSLQSRHFNKGIEIGPGPGSYETHRIRSGVLSQDRAGPKLSLGERSRFVFKDEAPPPNSYVITRDVVGGGSATRRGAPQWSLVGRSAVGGSQYDRVRAGVPGPANYAATDPGVTKRKSASYSMMARTRQKNYNSAKDNPGPGAYSPQSAPNRRGGVSMGTRHSQYMMPLIVDLDIM